MSKTNDLEINNEGNLVSKFKTNNADLRYFLSLLVMKNDLVEIKRNVDPKFELAAIVSKFENKQSVLFSNVGKTKFNVISNLLGTRERFALSMGATSTSIHNDFSHLVSRLGSLPKVSDEPEFMSNWSNSLNDLPIVTHFEKDAGPYITSSTVFALDKEAQNQNSSIHRLLLLDDKHLVIRMVEGRHLHKCYSISKEMGEDLRIAICIGLHPAINIAAAYQIAYGIDEMRLANSILQNSLTISKTSNSDLFVPSHSEIVIEGRVLKDVTADEWMVEMLRTYDHKRKQPVIEIEKIHYRDNPIYYDILPGYLEHRYLMGLPVEVKMFDSIKSNTPNTKSVHLTDGGSNWLNAVVQIGKRLEGEPKNVILSAFASHPSLKMVVVVDDDIDPTNPREVEYAISTRCQADKDIIIIPNSKGSSLDPSSDQNNLLTTKIGIDATATLMKPKERFEIAKIPGQENIDINKYMD